MSSSQERAPARPRRQWWLQPRSADGLALAAGLLLPFAFSPFVLWPLALLAPGLLFSVWLQAGPGRAAWRGWLFGLGSFGVGISWILSSFKFANIMLPVAIPLTLGFIGFLSLYPACAGYVMARIVWRNRPEQTRRPVLNAGHYLGLMPAGFVCAEWLRGWFLSGFSWLQLGYSQVDGPLRGILPISGVYGASLVMAVSAGGCVWLLLQRNRTTLLLSCLPVLFIWLLVISINDRAWTRVTGDPLKVAIVQGNIPQDQKWQPRMRRPTLERYLDLTRKHWDARLIVWPETAVPGTHQSLRPFLDRLAAKARTQGASVLYGIPDYDSETGQIFNSTVLAGVDHGRYRKHHLVPFGEYLPLNALLRPVVNAFNIPVSNWSPGTFDQPALELGGIRLAMFICYEITFGQEVAATLPDAAVLVTVSNDAWFGDSFGPHQHLQIARARAIETGRYLLRATNTGISAIIDPFGKVKARLPQFQARSLSGKVRPMAGATPYVYWGDWPVICLAIVMLLAGVRWRSRGDGHPG